MIVEYSKYFDILLRIFEDRYSTEISELFINLN